MGTQSGLGVGHRAALAAFESALATFAGDLTLNFASLTSAQPEDQLKAPVSALLKAAGSAAGKVVVTRTETRVAGVAGRPDIGMDVNGLLTGSAELKAPGKGADPSKFSDKRDREQFERFRSLPNLLYTDGREWALFRSGEQVGPLVVLSADPTTAGAAGVTPADASALLDLLGLFLEWEPIAPGTPRALASTLAPLARVLRDEVKADTDAGGPMALLADDWRSSLLPDANNDDFADAYAQTFTYALLLARLEGAAPPLTATSAAAELRSDHALLSEALNVLAQPAARAALALPVSLLERVIGAVDPSRLQSRGDPWLYFYEDFLTAYDPVERNNRGVYITPIEVVRAQVRTASTILGGPLGEPHGFAAPDVITLDPATGTGTYPLTIIRETLDAAEQRSGPGVRPQVATDLAERINAFEFLVGPYAVAHLQLSRELAEEGAVLPADGAHVFLTDTLSAPASSGGAAHVSLFQQRLAKEQEDASQVKDPSTRVTVIIGNPPWDRDESESAKGVRRKGGMVRYDPADPSGATPGLIEAFLAPLRAAGAGGEAKNLYNDYVYFWRWAIWKACEQNDGPAIVSLITPSSYLKGPWALGMRQVMRQAFDEIWVLDLGGEGRGTRKEDNVFPGILVPVVVTVGIRLPPGHASSTGLVPADASYRRIRGTRSEKLAALSAMHDLGSRSQWLPVSNGWTDAFTPAGSTVFDTWPTLFDLFPWRHSGVETKRSWPMAEDPAVLSARWAAFTAAAPDERAGLLNETRDRKVSKEYTDGLTSRKLPALNSLPATAPAPAVQRYAFRSFNRHWLLADTRLCDYLRPDLWATTSVDQVFLATLTTDSLGSGPAVTAAAHVPDRHFFSGRGGKDIVPLWRDASAAVPNVTTGLLAHLSGELGNPISAPDLLAYVFALLGTGAYTRRFYDELDGSVARVPLTRDAALFQEAVDFGRDLLWWGTFAERFQPKASGRSGSRLPAGAAKNTVPVSAAPADYPTSMSYDPETETLVVGDGQFAPVSQAMWDFEVSGLRVIRSWIGYRLQKRAGRRSSDLDALRPDRWTFSVELVELLAVVEKFVGAEQQAQAILDRVLNGPLIDPASLPLPSPTDTAPPPRPTGHSPGEQLNL